MAGCREEELRAHGRRGWFERAIEGGEGMPECTSQDLCTSQPCTFSGSNASVSGSATATAWPGRVPAPSREEVKLT